ncbi:ribonuclease H-like domain-containing protein, partial [Tanacetum coccineum]
YVDDIVLTGNDINEINKVKTFLKSKFKIKDLGELKYFLGIEVLKAEKGGLYLSQRKYCLELLHDCGLLACKPVSTPLAENIILAHKESKDDNQHMQAPLQSHMDLGLRFLKYLKGAPVSGYCVFFNDCMVSWKRKKQATLSKSFAEAEYRSMSAATCAVMWVVNILKDLKVTNLLPAELFCDDSAAIQIAANLVMHEKTKHFDLDVHIIREKVASGLIKTAKIDSENQTADIFTKALGFPQQALLLTAYCLLLTAYCLLLTAYCLLLTAYCLLLTAYCLLLTAYCLLLTAYCLLLTAYCLLLTAYCLLLTAYCLLLTAY